MLEACGADMRRRGSRMRRRDPYMRPKRLAVPHRVRGRQSREGSPKPGVQAQARMAVQSRRRGCEESAAVVWRWRQCRAPQRGRSAPKRPKLGLRGSNIDWSRRPPATVAHFSLLSTRHV